MLCRLVNKTNTKESVEKPKENVYDLWGPTSGLFYFILLYFILRYVIILLYNILFIIYFILI
jgi:hypothetical protein